MAELDGIDLPDGDATFRAFTVDGAEVCFGTPSTAVAEQLWGDDDCDSDDLVEALIDYTGPDPAAVAAHAATQITAPTWWAQRIDGHVEELALVDVIARLDPQDRDLALTAHLRALAGYRTHEFHVARLTGEIPDPGADGDETEFGVGSDGFDRDGTYMAERTGGQRAVLDDELAGVCVACILDPDDHLDQLRAIVATLSCDVADTILEHPVQFRGPTT